MKFSSFNAFEKHIEGCSTTRFSSLYLVLSEEGEKNRLPIDHLVEKLLKKEGIDPLAVKRAKGEDALFELKSLNFFSKSQVLIVEEVENFKKEGIEAFVQGAPNTYIILSGKSLHASYCKKVEKDGVILDLTQEKSWQKEKGAQEWLLTEAKREGKRMDPQAALFLAKETGSDFSSLTQELNKLIAYTDGRAEITITDVKKLVHPGGEVSIFELSDALFKNEGAKAVSLFRALLSGGESFFMLVKQLRNQILTDLKIASLVKEGRGAEIATYFPYIKGFILDKHMETVRYRGFEWLKKALVKVDDYELKAKDGQTDYELLADLLIAELL